MIQYIADREHYTQVLALCEKVKHDLWIGTADLKDLYIEGGRDVVPFLSILDKLLKRGVDVRLLHAKEPGENFREDFDKYPGLWSRLERRPCPQVHFKIVIFDDVPNANEKPSAVTDFPNKNKHMSRCGTPFLYFCSRNQAKIQHETDDIKSKGKVPQK